MNHVMSKLAALAAMALAGCSAQTTVPMARTQAGQKAPLVIAGHIRATTSIASVAITVDGTPVPGSPFPVVDGHFGPVTVQVAPGNHTVAASAGDYAGSATANATFGGPNGVTLYLVDTGSVPELQTVPVVEALSATPSTLVVTSGLPPPTATLGSKTMDFDANATVHLLWTDSCGGTFGDATAAAPTYTPAAFGGANTTDCILKLTATAETPNGLVSDPLFSVGTQVVKVTYVAPLVINGEIVTAPAFAGASLVFEGRSICPLAWLSTGEASNVALSADACDPQLYGSPYPPGRSIALQASFDAPLDAVGVSAAGFAECDGYGRYPATGDLAGSVGGGRNTATFEWPAGAVSADTACQIVVTVTFTAPGSSSPSSVSSSLPVSFRFHPPIAQTVFDGIPAPIPPNVPSQPFQAQQTLEFGDDVQLAGTARIPAFATVLVSNWAPRSAWPAYLDPTGFDHPITFNVYEVDLTTTPGTPQAGALIGSVTQAVHIPWRPEATPEQCSGDAGAWLASDGGCYHGIASTITIDLSTIATLLPDRIIYGIAYDTMTWGYHPLGVDGPYDSLNVGLAGDGSSSGSTTPSLGTDVEPDAVFWYTVTADSYADDGLGGLMFRQDTGWTGYTPAVRLYMY